MTIKPVKVLALLLVIFFQIPSFATDLKCATVFPLMNGFLAQHLTYKKLSSRLENRTVDQFLKSMDPSKLYFMQSDIKKLEKKLRGVFKQVRSRQCADVVSVQKLYEKRVKDSLTYAKKALGKNFKFNKKTTLVIEPKKRGYARNKKQLEALQNRYLQFQIANYLTQDMKLKEAKKRLIKRYELAYKRVKETSNEDVLAGFLDSFASALDPHSSFLSKEVLADFEITMRLSLEGIGATLRSDHGYTVIENLIPGGAAAKSDLLEPKDKIIAVGQGKKGKFDDVIDMSLRDVVKKIRGKAGSIVRLSILRQGKKTERFNVELKRAKIDLESEAAKLSWIKKKVGKKKLKIAVINLPSFYSDSDGGERSCSEDVKKLVRKAVKKKADGLILDLSKNGGGVLAEAVRVAGLFIKKGHVVQTQDSTGRVETLSDLDSTLDYKGPMVVLTSRLSASASEIVAGALRDYKRAVIVGDGSTFGKGSVQAVMKLREGLGAIKVTTGMFFIPGGDSTQELGVVADVKIPGPYSTDVSESALDYVLPKKSLPSFLSPEANNNIGGQSYSAINSSTIGELQKLSSSRTKKSKEFQKIIKDLADAEKKNGIVVISEMMKKNTEAEVKKKKRKKGKKAEEKEYLSQPDLKEASNVLVDLIKIEGRTRLAKKGQQASN